MYGSIGKLAVTGIPMTTNQAIAHAIPSADVNVWWLFWQLMADRALLIQGGAGATQSNISQRFLRSWQVPLPPLEEQDRIVAELDRMMTALGHAQAIAQQRRCRTAAMTNAILRLAFPP